MIFTLRNSGIIHNNFIVYETLVMVKHFDFLKYLYFQTPQEWKKGHRLIFKTKTTPIKSISKMYIR